MLLCSLLVLSPILSLTSAQLNQQSTSTTSGPLLLPTSGPDDSLDLGHIGSTIGGASAGAVGVVIIALAFGTLRWSRRQSCSYHNKELRAIVPSLQYRKRNVDIETASEGSFEDLQLPAPALLSPTSHRTAAAAKMHDKHFGLPPSYSNSTQRPLDHSS